MFDASSHDCTHRNGCCGGDCDCHVTYDEPVIGAAISNADLPRHRDRLINDLGPRAVELFNARTEDNLDYFIDLRRFLEPGDAVRSAFASVQLGKMLLTNVSFAPSGVVVWAAGGDNDTRQRISCTFRTLKGRTKNVQWVVRTFGDPIDLTITVTPPQIIVVGDGTE